jgi:pimeloyl-ACP methyl ester carboxylesterase
MGYAYVCIGLARGPPVANEPELAFDLREGDGEPLVFLHGLACDRAQLSELIRNLGGRYTILNVDMPGHGHSSLIPAHSIAELAQAVTRLVQQMFDRPVTLVGHSMGASVGLDMVPLLGSGVRHVIALDSLLADVLYRRRGPLLSAAMSTALAADYRRGMTKLLSDLFVDETSPELRRQIIETAVRTRKEVSGPLFGSLLRWDRDHALAVTDVPVTIVAARTRAKPKEIDRLSDRCRVVLFPRGGHFFPLEFPLETARAVEEAVSHVAPGERWK